jgi:hypothetical protein
MTSWRHFLFHSAPWHWRIMLAASIPLWVFRVQKIWRFAGGWVQRYGTRLAVGIKPPRILQLADRSIGAQIFVQEKEINEKVEQVTCHELTHAHSAHLRLPMWLNEGLAMVTVDKLAGQPTVRFETVETLDHLARRAVPGASARGSGPESYRSVQRKDTEVLVYHVVRGYWLTRYIVETQPDLLKGLLARRQSHRTLEDKVATALGMDREAFWRRIDGIVASHFKEKESVGAVPLRAI